MFCRWRDSQANMVVEAGQGRDDNVYHDEHTMNRSDDTHHSILYSFASFRLVGLRGCCYQPPFCLPSRTWPPHLTPHHLCPCSPLPQLLLLHSSYTLCPPLPAPPHLAPAHVPLALTLPGRHLPTGLRPCGVGVGVPGLNEGGELYLGVSVLGCQGCGQVCRRECGVCGSGGGGRGTHELVA